jgi:DNA helicase-2/ATP-dependent DNA helicase PcrA
MNTSHDLLDMLNDRQREAVSSAPGHFLVLAGAGSGKTRVLVHRIAWLIQAEEFSPHSILAVTFTNKAAGEMRHRLSELIGYAAQGMWVGTFHGLAHRLLRTHWEEAHLPEGFQILDSDDQQRMVKRVLKNMGLSEEKWPPKQVQSFINHQKDQGIRPQHLNGNQDYYTKTMRELYLAYEQACQTAGVIDFAEILLRAHELYLHKPEILAHYQNRFRQILVDEFQDTNAIQYAWIRLLAGDHIHVTVVGDDDQSIYGWRGAKIENIHRFQEDFKQTKTIRLEQNYRSTGNILKAANAVIDNNPSRLGKKLWTDSGEGKPIALYAAFNEIDEARYVVERIRLWILEGHSHKEAAILYRSNAQSRVIEEALMQASLPYRVYGGLRFFERAEIKDVLAYLRLIANRCDDAAFERVVNLPARGLGDKTLEELREFAKQQQISLWNSARQLIQSKKFAARAHQALSDFLTLIDELDSDTQHYELQDKTQQVIKLSGLWDYYANSKERDKAEARLENMQELINAARQFRMDEYASDESNILSEFLAHVSLDAGDSGDEPSDNKVQLMTLHAAKGLEFPLVCIVGMEEGLFPSRMSMEEPGKLEEERRLFYVGMTRAMKQLILSHAEVRRQYGREEYHRPSRFLQELPEDVFEEVRPKATPFNKPAFTPTSDWGRNNYYSSPKIPPKVVPPPTTANDSGFRVGENVSHPKFGDGVIADWEGSGAHQRVQVKFKQHGVKWLVLAYAQLKKADA